MDKQYHLERWALVCLFLLTFLPRAIYPVSRPLQWYFRSAEFFQAVLHSDWAGTLFSEHPGVTVMWLSGAALWGWYGLQSLLGFNPPTPLKTAGFAFADRVAVGVLPLALVVALGIVWGWHLLRKLFGKRVAWVAALLWALDPFYLTNSKVLHLDAILSTLMVLSALWMLIYLQERRRRALITSSILGGLAILTKLPALFLIPFAGLCLLSEWLPHPRNLRPLPMIRDLVLWVAIAAVVFFILWPSMWVQPARSLNKLFYRGLVRHVDEAHQLPRFHRGTLSVGDPGAGFYLDTVLFRSTFLTLPFSLLGLLAAFTQKRDAARFTLLIIAFAVFFFVQMILGGRKDSRYMLPVLLAIDVVSAVGIVWWAERLHAKTRLPARHAVPLMLLVQAILVLAHFPYFATLYNEMLGGPQVAMHSLPLGEFGAGLDLAGQYVDSQPDAQQTTVGTQFLANEMLAQYVRAPVKDIAQVRENVGYLVFGVQYTTRGVNFPRWGELWEQTYKFREPAFVASFDGISYAWVHRPNEAPVIPQQMDHQFGEAIQLEGYCLADSEIAPGGTLLLTLYWRAKAPVANSYTVFTHLQRPGGQLITQKDNIPARGARPTNAWDLNALIEDPYELDVPPDIPFGDYVLSVGMYDSMTLERLAAFDAQGERLPNDRVVLTNVQVQPKVPHWRRALSGIWLAGIAGGVVWPWLKSRR